jgi:hypothetical protein
VELGKIVMRWHSLARLRYAGFKEKHYGVFEQRECRLRVMIGLEKSLVGHFAK